MLTKLFVVCFSKVILYISGMGRNQQLLMSAANAQTLSRTAVHSYHCCILASCQSLRPCTACTYLHAYKHHTYKPLNCIVLPRAADTGGRERENQRVKGGGRGGRSAPRELGQLFLGMLHCGAGEGWSKETGLPEHTAMRQQDRCRLQMARFPQLLLHPAPPPHRTDRVAGVHARQPATGVTMGRHSSHSNTLEPRMHCSSTVQPREIQWGQPHQYIAAT